MSNKAETICVIPAYNEEETIKEIISRCRRYVDTVLVVNDASTDDTAAIVKQSNVKLLSNSSNLGYEISIRKGFNYAIENNYSYLVFIDGDGQHPCNLIPEFLSKLRSGDSLVLGRRKNLTRFSEKFASILYTIFLGIGDPFCGMKGFNIKHVNSRFPLTDSKSFGLDFLVHYLKFNSRYSQINMLAHERVSGKSRVGLNELYIDVLLINSSISALFKIIFAKIERFCLHVSTKTV